MSSVTCSSCLRTITKSESRPIEDGENKIIGRTCQSCRNEAIRLRCSAVKCKTPHYKIKDLKSVPESVGDLPTEKRNSFLQNEFGSVALSKNLRCCAACYVRLHRLSCNKENSTLVIVQPSQPSQRAYMNKNINGLSLPSLRKLSSVILTKNCIFSASI